MISVYVVRNNRIIINTVSGFDQMAFFTMAYFDGAFHDIDKLFAFMRGERKVGFLCRFYVHDEWFLSLIHI